MSKDFLIWVLIIAMMIPDIVYLSLTYFTRDKRKDWYSGDYKLFLIIWIMIVMRAVILVSMAIRSH